MTNIPTTSQLVWVARLIAIAAGVAVIRPLHAEDLRIGLVGLDTSHVQVYLQLFNSPDAKDHIGGGRIVAAYKGGSADIPLSSSRVDGFAQLAVEKFGVKLCTTIEELATQVDAVMILSVDGRTHLDQFRQLLKARKPVFIDKPLAGSLRDAVEIVHLARGNGVPCFSSSSLRFAPDRPAADSAALGAISAAYSFGPAQLEPHHPDLFWYGIHTVESLYTALGQGCVRVVRTSTERTDVITGIWSDGRVGTVQGNRDGHHGYGITLFGAKGILSGGEHPSYRPLAVEILKFLKSGVAPVSLDTTLEILAFMEAADESKRRGGVPVTLAEVLSISQAKR